MNYLIYSIWLFFLISAFNSANNLFYLVFALLSGFLVAPAIIARRYLSNLQLNVKLEKKPFAGESVAAAFEVINASAADKFMLEIFSMRPECIINDGRITYLPSSSSVLIKSIYKFETRGVKSLGPLFVKVNIPFLLREKKTELSLLNKLIVYPKIVSIKTKLRYAGELRRNIARDRDLIENEYSRFKEYCAGDSPAKINWRHYCLTRTLIVPENLPRALSDYSLILILPEDYESGSRRFELAVSIAASIVSGLLAVRKKINLICVSDKIQAFDSRSSSIDKFLTQLALIDKNCKTNSTVIARAVSYALGSACVIVVSSCPNPQFSSFKKSLGFSLKKIIIASEREKNLDDKPDDKMVRDGVKYVEITTLEELKEMVI